MDTNLLVDKQYEEGRKLIEKLDARNYKYPIALWINDQEQNGWTLIFGIPKLKILGSKDILMIMHEIIIKNNIDLSLSNISLVDITDEICKSLKSTLKKTGLGIEKILFAGNYINGHRFPDSIIYRVN